MENASTIFHTAVEFGFSPMNLVLIAMVYFMGAHSGIFPKFWGAKNSNSDNGEKPATQAQMNRLSEYYNHDTTAILNDIKEHLFEVKEETKNMNTNLKELHTITNRLETTIREWERYGVPKGKN